MRPVVHDTLITKSLIIVDEKEKPRVVVHPTSKKQGVCLELLDSEQLARLQLRLDESGNPNVHFLEKDGSLAISIAVNHDSRRTIQINSPSGNPGILLIIHPNGDRHVEILDESFKSQWRVPSE